MKTKIAVSLFLVWLGLVVATDFSQVDLLVSIPLILANLIYGTHIGEEQAKR